jgi:terminase large subunit-like protein
LADFSIRSHKGDIYIPLPTQAAFHQSKARYRSYIGFLSAGKSLCGSVEAFTRAISKPGHRPGRTIICRESYPQLIKSTWKTFRGVVEQSCPDLIERETQSTYDIKLVLKNGWEFWGMNLRNHQDFGSIEADDIWIDEANDDGIGMDSYSMLVGRAGRNILPYEEARAWTTGNPGGRNWLYDLFFKHRLEGGRKIEDHEGFQPKPDENIHMDADYWNNLRRIYSDEWIAKFLEGSFDVFEGQILDNLDRDIHVIDDFAIPPEWPRYRGLDHGWTNPTACLWIAVDPAGNHYLYREFYKRCAVPQTNAEAILAISGAEEEMTQWTVMDPHGRHTQTAGGSAQRIIDQYREGGLICRLGDNDVKASIARLKSLLQPDTERIFPRCHKYAGQNGAPQTFIFRSLRYLISEAQQWQWKQVKPGGVDKETPLAKHDHLIACWRYLEMELPRAPQVTAPRSYDWLSDALNSLEPAGLENPKNLIGAR